MYIVNVNVNACVLLFAVGFSHYTIDVVVVVVWEMWYADDDADAAADADDDADVWGA